VPHPVRRVVVTQRFSDANAIGYLERHGCEVVINEAPAGRADGDLSERELREVLAQASGWVVGHAHVTRALLESLPDLQVVARRGVGYEHIDVEAARSLGRVVTIAAGGDDASVADHTLGLMLAVSRRMRESQIAMLEGRWSILSGLDLYRKTVGIIGLGRIGRSVAQRLLGFEAQILVNTPKVDPRSCRAPVQYVELPELLRRSDIVTVHAPLTPATRFLLGADAFSKMKDSAILINAACGGLVDDAALLTALQGGRLAGAGLDVFVSETDPTYRSITQALIALPNVVATPHAAASSREGLARTNLVAAEAVVAVLEGGNPRAECVVVDGRACRSRAV
jgi:D-3-phosphoglycerate dehydrogenase / 2-oxoglutarate reductase